MKICPRCQKTYTDDNLNFCLEDGTVLAQASSNPMPDTVFVNQPRSTAPAQQVPSQGTPQAGWNTAPQPYSQPPKKSSKTWIWVLLILGGLVLLCGGGFVGVLIYGINQAEKAANQIATNTSKSPAPAKVTTNTKSNTSTTTTPTTTSTSTDRVDVESVDLSEWVKENSLFGITEFTGDELIMASKQKRFYYVLAGGEDQKTENADTRVTLRNVNNGDSSLGYGLVFHSNPTPLQQGYAFLIDSKKKKYRVVHHSPQAEDSVVGWTKSDSILDGAQENTLEVRDYSDRIDLFINGQMVDSIKNVYGYKGGVCGLYSGDGVKIAFKNMEIAK